MSGGMVIRRAAGGDPVVLESDALRVSVHPQVGGTIAAIEHKGLGASVLGTTPWQPELTPLEPDTEVPIAYWNRAITDAERQALRSPERWQGPYLAFKKTTTLGLLLASNYPALWRNGGPIFHIGNGGGAATTLGIDSDDDRYPVDPWGSPYIFFAPGRLNNSSSGLTESTFGNGAVYSLGPNGVPGDLFFADPRPVRCIRYQFAVDLPVLEEACHRFESLAR